MGIKRGERSEACGPNQMLVLVLLLVLGLASTTRTRDDQGLGRVPLAGRHLNLAG